MAGDSKTKSFWSGSLLARLYRRFAGRHFAKMHGQVARTLAEAGVSSVLDIACGPGDFLALTKGRNPQLRIAGTDAAPGMVAYARARLGEGATIAEAEAERQPFPSESFDSVTTMMAFHHFSNRPAILGEVKRVLKPGGSYVVADVVADVVATSDFQKKFWNFLERLTGVRGHTEHFTEADLASLAAGAGFEDFECEPVPGMARRYRICSLRNPVVR